MDYVDLKVIIDEMTDMFVWKKAQLLGKNCAVYLDEESGALVTERISNLGGDKYVTATTHGEIIEDYIGGNLMKLEELKSMSALDFLKLRFFAANKGAACVTAAKIYNII